MELEILRMLIEKRNKKLEEPYKRHYAYDYLVDAKEHLNDDEKLLIAYLIINTDKPIDECLEIIRSFGTKNIILSDSALSMLINLLIYFKSTKAYPEVVSYLLEKNLFKKSRIWSKMELTEKEKNIVMSLSDIIRLYKVNIQKLIQLLDENQHLFLNICSILMDIKEKKYDSTTAKAKRKLYLRIMGNDDNYTLFNKKLKPTLPTLEEAKTTIRKYVETLELEEKNYYKAAKLEQFYNDTALQQLEIELKKTEITNVRPLIKRLVDEQIKEVILAIVYKHNLNYSKKLMKEYNTLMSNSTTRYLSLLHESGISITEEELGTITNNSIEELTEILSIIRGLIQNESLLLKVIKITNLETTKEVKELVIKGYISNTILNENIEIFDNENRLLNILKTNITIFNNYQINPTAFSNIEEILFIDSKILETNLKVLENYNLIKSIKNSNNYKFLLNEELATLLDKYLELGYENILEIDLDILNYQDTRRVEILANMGITLEKKELVEMFEYDKFFIPDELLDDYISNTIIISGTLDLTLEELMEYRKTTRTLEINGHLISINKILRCIDNHFSLKEAIYFNMNIEQDAYQEIEEGLIGKSYSKEN